MKRPPKTLITCTICVCRIRIYVTAVFKSIDAQRDIEWQNFACLLLCYTIRLKRRRGRNEKQSDHVK